jgi:hypothetical protein
MQLPKANGAEDHRKRDWRLHRRNSHNNTVLRPDSAIRGKQQAAEPGI